MSEVYCEALCTHTQLTHVCESDVHLLCTGMANVEEAPVKKRKPGRPKKCGSDLSAGMTETIVDKKTKNMGMLHINTSSATNSNCGNTSSSSSSSSGSSGGGSSGVPKRKSKLSTPSKQSSKVKYLDDFLPVSVFKESVWG